MRLVNVRYTSYTFSKSRNELLKAMTAQQGMIFRTEPAFFQLRFFRRFITRGFQIMPLPAR